MGEVTENPLCFNVISKAPYPVFGSFNTDYYTTTNGQRARHRANFRLNENETSTLCSTGPFFTGQKLDLVIRTIIPVFQCRTGINGDIVIYGRPRAEGRGNETWAVCL